MLNEVRIMGHLAADPEVRTTPSGATVANFRVACTEKWKDQSGQAQERTEWVTVVAWGRSAEIAQQYLRKGARVYASGKLQTRTWEDKNGGGKRYATEVLADRILLVDRKDDRPVQGQGEPRQPREQPRQGAPELNRGYTSPSAQYAPVEDDDLPF